MFAETPGELSRRVRRNRDREIALIAIVEFGVQIGQLA